MRPNLIARLKEEWNNLDPVDPLRRLIADAIDALAEKTVQQHIEHCLWARNGHTPCPHVQPAQQQEPEDLSDFMTNVVKNRMDVWGQTTDAYVRGNGSEPSSEETLLRGILASEVKCWHRLTADEAQNLVAFVQNMPAKLREKNA